MSRLILLGLLAIPFSSFSQEAYLFVGSYTTGKSKGIYVYRFNLATGTGKEVSTLKVDNPSYITVSQDGKFLYSAGESDSTGLVSSFAFDSKKGKLRLLNSQSSLGGGTCYIAETKNQKWVTTANYGSGSLVAYPVNSDGSLAPAAQIIQHTGSGANKQRQEAPHVHSTIFSPDEQYLFVADLGTDKEHIYRFDGKSPTPLSEAADSAFMLSPGSGPRHIAFHPSKPWMYLLSELSGTVDVFKYDSGAGKISPLQRIRNTPESFKGDPGSADIHLTSDGKYLYASNRGDADNIAVYTVGEDGTLTNKQYVSVKGKHPRNFVIDPTDHYLLVANKDSDNVVIFTIDPNTGMLTATGQELHIPNPTCLKFLMIK